MELNDYEDRLNAAQEKLDKALKLLDKYKNNKVKYLNQVAELEKQGKNILDNAWLRDNWSLISNEDYDLKYKVDTIDDTIRSTERKIKDLTITRDNWKTRLEVQKAKDNQLDEVPQVIKDFVHNWREKAQDYYLNAIIDYKSQYNKIRSIYKESQDYTKSNEERSQIYQDYKSQYDKLIKSTDDLVRELAFKRDYENELDKILNQEEKRKILDLINRVTKVVGKIIDASNLSIGYKNGELNGIIQGTDGKCYVETIGAGGYNQHIIVNDKHGQCFHYRVLIKKI